MMWVAILLSSMDRTMGHTETAEQKSVLWIGTMRGEATVSW